MLRWMLSSHGKFIAHEAFGFASGGNASSYTQLFVAFSLSGAVHEATILATFNRADWTWETTQFFILQAVAITIEDGVLWIGERFSNGKMRRWIRILGYAWVVLWMRASLPIYLNVLTRGGFGTLDVVPFSVFSRIILMLK
jgi:hypothetical protein